MAAGHHMEVMAYPQKALSQNTCNVLELVEDDEEQYGWLYGFSNKTEVAIVVQVDITTVIYPGPNQDLIISGRAEAYTS